MSSDRKKFGVAFWVTVVVAVVLLAYPISFGPACWWFTTDRPPGEQWPRYGNIVTLSSIGTKYVSKVYWPFASAAQNGPPWLRKSIDWYATLHGGKVSIPSDWGGTSYLILSAGYSIPSALESGPADEDEDDDDAE